jgi:hypothetical protein
MGKVKNFFSNLKRLTSMPQHNTYGGGGWSNLIEWLNPGSKINFAQEVGDLANVTLCQSAIGWVARNLYDARLRTVELDRDEKESELQPDELAKLFYAPNPFYSGQALIAGIALDWITGSRSYLIKVRGGFNNVKELWWEPKETIRPRWVGDDFISYYEIERDGIWKRVEVEDVVPITNGVNPKTRLALINPTNSLITEFYTEKRAAYFMNLLLRSGLVPPIVVSLGDKDRPMDNQAKFDEAKSQIKRKASGDGAAEPLVTNDAVNVERLGYDYSSVGLKEVRQIPVSRFCMAMGISAVSLNADAGNSTNATYANVAGYLKQDYRGYIVPLHNLIASALNVHLLPDFGLGDNAKVDWDYSQTALMQADKVAETKNATLVWVSGGSLLNEYREAVDLEQKPEFEKLNYFDVSGKKQAMGNNNQNPNQPTDATVESIADATAKSVVKKLGYSDSELDESAETWRNHDKLTPLQRSLIDAPEYKPNGHLPS